VERLQRTIDQILTAAGTERRARRRPVDLVALLRECADDARKRHDLPEDAIRLALPSDAMVKGEVEQLRVAFRNLIENAIRYGGDGIVDVSVRFSSPRRLEVQVADQGMGIPPSALGRVFQRFQRMSHEAGFHTPGLGLGLFIVRNIVRAHGGSVRAESDGLGTGSRFIVTLPGQVDGHAHPAG
jgi:signal transduction histidine kinase